VKRDMEVRKVIYIYGEVKDVNLKVNQLVEEGWQPVGSGIPFENAEYVKKWWHNVQKISKEIHVMQTMVLYDD